MSEMDNKQQDNTDDDNCIGVYENCNFGLVSSAPPTYTYFGALRTVPIFNTTT